MNASSRLDLCNCFAARQAARYVTRLYERYLADVELTSNQFAILVMLDDTPGASMREMAEALVMDRTSLVRALKPMQRDGLVVAGGDASGSRQNLFSLGAEGEARLKAALPKWAQAQREFEARVGKAEAATMRETALALGRKG